MQGTALPETMPAIPPEDFTEKVAVGFAPHVVKDGISYLGVFPIPNSTLIRSFGGTANPANSLDSEVQALQWARDRGYAFPMEIMKEFIPLHELEIHGVPLVPNRPGLPPISHFETHGVIPAEVSYMEAHPEIPWLSLQDGKVSSTVPGVTWANAGLKSIFSHMLEQVAAHGTAYTAMDVKEDVFYHNPFSSQSQPL